PGGRYQVSGAAHPSSDRRSQCSFAPASAGEGCGVVPKGTRASHEGAGGDGLDGHREGRIGTTAAPPSSCHGHPRPHQRGTDQGNCAGSTGERFTKKGSKKAKGCNGEEEQEAGQGDEEEAQRRGGEQREQE